MSYLDQPSRHFSLNAARMLLGALAASAVPALAFTFPRFDEAQGVFAMGCFSIFTVYLPLMAWRLPRTRHPLLLSIGLGMVAAPGPIGIGLAAAALFYAPLAAPLIMLLLAPLGALGGLVFWLCALWRNPYFAAAEAD
ncbi:MAG: hypothetical protein QOG13_2165 [Sphingomonadales bacterium]|nr:hypothetical protein [Sphingomonadales bacterium]MEA3044840.1 hypothetical protein [Sphingomonadales bacterium]